MSFPQKIRSIVTHPGGAHKDDFLACSLMVAQAGVVVERREPNESDLANKEVCVIDVGGEHEASRMNFDHHQFPRDHPPVCAITLVLQHLGIYEDARDFCDWLEPAEWFDTRGPKDTAAWLGVERDVVSKLFSPIDGSILRRFAGQDRHAPGETVYEVMRFVGEDLLGFVTTLKDRLAILETHAQVWELGGGMKAVYVARSDALQGEPSMGLHHYIVRKEMEKEVVAMVYPDRRGAGYGMSRYNDDQRMDFSLTQSEPDVHFAHARGFVAKTSATQVDRLKKLLGLASVIAP